MTTTAITFADGAKLPPVPPRLVLDTYDVAVHRLGFGADVGIYGASVSYTAGS